VEERVGKFRDGRKTIRPTRSLTPRAAGFPEVSGANSRADDAVPISKSDCHVRMKPRRMIGLPSPETVRPTAKMVQAQARWPAAPKSFVPQLGA